MSGYGGAPARGGSRGGGPGGRSRGGGPGGGGRGRGGPRGGGRGGGCGRGAGHGRGGPGARGPPRRPRTEMTEEDKRRELTKRLEETKEMLKNLQLDEGDTVMAPKREPGSAYGTKINLDTNVFGLKLKEVNVYRYDITIDGEIRQGDRSLHRDFTKRTKDDVVVTDRKNLSREVFHRIMDKYPHLCDGGNHKAVYYDLSSIMHTLTPLELKGEKNMREEFELTADDFQKEVPEIQGTKLKEFAKIRFELRQVEDHHIITLNDLTHITQDVMTTDNSLKQFLELATSQHALFDPANHVSFQGGQTFLMDHAKHGFTEADVPHLSDDKYLAMGAGKSVRFVEGPKGRANCHAALVVEAKKTCFHADNIRLTDKVRAIKPHFNMHSELRQSDLGQLNNKFKGLTVEVRYRTKPIRFRISGVSSETAAGKTFTSKDGRKMSIADYYHQQYGIKLNYPLAPLVTSIETTAVYPMEECWVVENQRVNKTHMTRDEDAKMIKACAVPPAQQQQQNTLISKALQIDNNNEWLQNAQIGITNKTLKVEARVLAPPAFLKAYIQKCHKRGLQMSNPAEWCRIENSAVAVGDKIKTVAENGGSFVLFVTSKTITELHKVIKLNERRHEIVTQDLKLSNVEDIIVRGRPATLENIVQKTNIKLGGLNYSITITESGLKDMFGSDVLYIGLAMSHPGSVGEYEKPRGTTLQYSNPSVVGFAANMVKHPYEFVGDCIFGEPRRDEKNYRGNLPRTIVIYRNGTSEGQFGMVLQFEVPLILHAIKESQCEAKLTIIVPTVRHNIRLFEHNIDGRAKSTDQNIKPGTVVDTGIVHPTYCEFYLNSHQALQGSAKTPKYTVLYDKNDFSMDLLEGMTHMLAFGHQIINMPTSLPSPVYIASQYAERGRNLFTEYKKQFGRDRSSDAFSLEKITNRLSYQNSVLGDYRINA